MTRVLRVLAVVLACSVPLVAQDAVRVAGRVPDPPAATDVVVGYDSGGRRDPFVSLVVPRRPAATRAAESGPRRTGLSALSVADAQVRGIVKHGTEMLAIVEGADNQSFVLHVKDRLFDAEVRAIDARGVVFVERLEAEDGRTPREIRKPLRPAGEGGTR